MRLLGVAVLVAGLAVSSPAVAQEAEVTERQHALLVVEMGPGGAQVAYARLVDLPLPGEVDGTWRIEVTGAGNQVLYTATLPDPGWLRGEYFEPPVEMVHLRPATIVVTLRLPIEPNATHVRVLAPAKALPQGDLRAAGLPPDAIVEVGSIAWPDVLE